MRGNGLQDLGGQKSFQPCKPDRSGNPEQQKAITHGAGPMMVLAGPGSGKTFVLTRRIAHLINTHHVNPSEILVITFTRAAAGEMQQRFLSLCEGEHPPVTFGTFHAVFYSILKETSRCRSGSILSEAEKKKILRDIIQRNRYDISMHTDMLEEILAEIGRYQNCMESRCFPYGNTGEAQSVCETNSRFLNGNTAKNQSVCGTAQKYIITKGSDNIDYIPQNISSELFRDLYRDFAQAKNILGKIDFDDMALKCQELFQERPDILRRYQARYRYLLIDEFQDIAPLQYHLVRLLAAPEDNLFIVGDDDQSIYGFRGARPDIMRNFPKDYPGAGIVALQVNYRSTPQVVSSAGKLILHNQNRFPKESRAAGESGAPLRVEKFENSGGMEAELVRCLLSEQRAGKLPNCAVISRTSACFPILSEKLRQAGVPCVFREKVKGIYEHEIVYDLLAYLEFCATPVKDRSRSQFFRFMNRPLRYISREAVSENADFGHLLRFYRGKPAMQEAVMRLQEDLERIRTMPVFLAVNYIRRGMGYDAYLLERFGTRDVRNGGEGGSIMEIADMIQNSAKGCKSLSQWKEVIEERRGGEENGRLSDRGTVGGAGTKGMSAGTCGGTKTREISAGTCADRNRNFVSNAGTSDDAAKEGVTLVTMHGSKGLEYDKVFIVNCNEGITPHRKARSAEKIEEERRMFYVAMTRAKKELALFYIDGSKSAEKEGGTSKVMPPSRFLSEIG